MDGAEGIAVRGLQAEVGEDKRLKWRILLIQPQKTAAEFQGTLELKITGLLAGKPWQMAGAAQPVAVRFSRSGRFQGYVDLPAQVVVKSISVRVMEGSKVRAEESANL